MSQFSQFVNSLIPPGDKLRMGTSTSILTTTTTLLTVSSGTAGMVYGINLTPVATGGAATVVVDAIKVTIDGAAERTFTGSFATVYFPSSASGSTGSLEQGFIALPINFTDSVVIKAEVSSASGGTIEATVIYSEK